MLEKAVGILAHRKMTEAGHDRARSARHQCGDFLGLRGRARIIVLAGQQKQRTSLDIDRGDALAKIAIDLVKMEIAFEDAGSATTIQ